MLISFCNNDGSHFVIQENVQSHFYEFRIYFVATSNIRGAKCEAQSVTVILHCCHETQYAARFSAR